MWHVLSPGPVTTAQLGDAAGAKLESWSSLTGCYDFTFSQELLFGAKI